MTSEIEADETGLINHRQGKPPYVVQIRWWLIRKIAGRLPVFLNLEVSPHTRMECEREGRFMECEYGLFSGSIRARKNHGVTFKQVRQVRNDSV